MATPKELVLAVADALCEWVETVTVHDRRLQEAQLRSRAKRGRGRNDVTPIDAANLIIATAGGRGPISAVETVLRFATVRDDVAKAIADELDRPGAARSGARSFKMESVSGDVTRAVSFSWATIERVASAIA
jgi:hypothetical protein